MENISAVTGAPAQLRVTLVVSAFPALSETFVLDQAIYLLERGFDVRIVAFEARAEAATHDQVALYGLLSRARYIRRPRSVRAKIRLVGAAVGVAKAGFIKAALAMRRARRVDGEVGYLTTLAALVVAFAEQEKPDLYLCHFGQNGSLTLRAVEALGWRTPVATIFHGFDITMLPTRQGPRLYKHLLANGHMFLPVCQYFANILEGWNAPRSKIHVQRMGVNIEQLAEAISDAGGKGSNPSSSHLTFLAVGRLVEKKGHANLLRAFSRAFGVSAPDEITLRIVGDGPLANELAELSRQRNIPVTFLGALTREQVFKELSAADVFLQPSITAPDGDMEGMPVSILEAMVFGKPVISTRHSGIPEVVADKITGLLVDETDEEALAGALVWALHHRSEMAQFGMAGRERAMSSFRAAEWNRLLEHRLRSLV